MPPCTKLAEGRLCILDECRRHDILSLASVADGKEKFLLLSWQLKEKGFVCKSALVYNRVECQFQYLAISLFRHLAISYFRK